MDYGIRSGKNPKLGYAHGTPRYSRLSKSLSLGMPPEGIPSFGNFTWSYIFIRHIICVLLGASFILLEFAFCYLEQCFASFISIKVALIAFTMPILQVFMLLFENRKFTAIAKIP